MKRIPWPAFAPEEPIARPSTAVVVRETTVPWPVFAPAESSIDHDAGSLTDRRDVVYPAIASTQPTTVSPPRPGPDSSWGQAINLTRQAVCAWMGVLVKTGSVQVTAR